MNESAGQKGTPTGGDGGHLYRIQKRGTASAGGGGGWVRLENRNQSDLQWHTEAIETIRDTNGGLDHTGQKGRGGEDILKQKLVLKG